MRKPGNPLSKRRGSNFFFFRLRRLNGRLTWNSRFSTSKDQILKGYEANQESMERGRNRRTRPTVRVGVYKGHVEADVAGICYCVLVRYQGEPKSTCFLRMVEGGYGRMGRMSAGITERVRGVIRHHLLFSTTFKGQRAGLNKGVV